MRETSAPTWSGVPMPGPAVSVVQAVRAGCSREQQEAGHGHSQTKPHTPHEARTSHPFWQSRRPLTLRERDHVDIAHPHTGLLDRLAHDTHHPLAVVPRRVGRQEPLAGRRNVRVSHIAEDSDEGCASLGGLVGDDAGAELVRAALDAECEEAVFCCQLGGGEGGRALGHALQIDVRDTKRGE